MYIQNRNRLRDIGKKRKGKEKEKEREGGEGREGQIKEYGL